MRTELQQMAFDAYYGTNLGKYSKENAEDTLRKMFLERIGEPIPESKSKMRRFMKKHKEVVFELLEETLTEVVNRISLDAFSDYVDFKTYDYGDKPVFRVKNGKRFKVSALATGIKTVERQRMHDRKVETEAFRLSVKIYEEAFDFLTGRINWTELCNKVAESLVQKIATLVTNCMFQAYDATANPKTHKTTNISGMETVLREVIQTVEAKTGAKAIIVGTKGALAAVPGSGGVYSVDDSKDKREFGYVKMFEGTPCQELPQYYDEELDELEVPTNQLLVLIEGEKVACLAYEGDLEVEESSDTTERNDYQIECEAARMAHIGVPVLYNFGMIKITD